MFQASAAQPWPFRDHPKDPQLPRPSMDPVRDPCCGTIGIHITWFVHSCPPSLSLTGCCRRFSHAPQNSTSAWRRIASSGPKFHTSSPSAVYQATTRWTSWTRSTSWCRRRGRSGTADTAWTAAWTTSAARLTNEITQSTALAFREKVDVTPSCPPSPRRRCFRANRLGHG